MDIRFVREKVAKGEVRVLHMPSRHQIADIFTKGLPRVLFDGFRDSLSVLKPPASPAGSIEVVEEVIVVDVVVAAGGRDNRR
ncbi:hypothetical protein OSB04_005600 [Centaurea solstitialis]|uniref:Uncharacterized protein n=1 Tax=Centaurea solstitialis TaxID=347529 RepID=A0AA38TT17_9ASTR|nr:hypothetical protein OSB04_005600 [Centaurea solstitialis]